MLTYPAMGADAGRSEKQGTNAWRNSVFTNLSLAMGQWNLLMRVVTLILEGRRYFQ
jgi:hypothetical protein